MLADAILEQSAGNLPDCVFSKNYQRGYEAGFVRTLEYGERACPPLIPPSRYWNKKFRSPVGLHAVDDWYAGFRDGVESATATGLERFSKVAGGCSPSVNLPVIGGSRQSVAAANPCRVAAANPCGVGAANPCGVSGNQQTVPSGASPYGYRTFTPDGGLGQPVCPEVAVPLEPTPDPLPQNGFIEQPGTLDAFGPVQPQVIEPGEVDDPVQPPIPNLEGGAASNAVEDEVGRLSQNQLLGLLQMIAVELPRKEPSETSSGILTGPSDTVVTDTEHRMLIRPRGHGPRANDNVMRFGTQISTRPMFAGHAGPGLGPQFPDRQDAESEDHIGN